MPSPLLDARPALRDELEPVLVASDLDELGPYLGAGKGALGRVPTFEAAGPRQKLYFDPAQIRAGILTSGGLCPGLNNVIRALTLALRTGYGVPSVLGFRFGFAGLADPELWKPLTLTAEAVKNIHQRGGSLLGSSRGHHSVETMVDNLERLDISQLFVIGGDGTLRGARALSEEIARRGVDIAVVGVPKTIDNDLTWIERSFGFATAVEEAERAIDAAHAEATGAIRGVGLVKLMGRHAGFIAAHASLSSSDVNFCLVPEVPFEFEGECGLLRSLEKRLSSRNHAVIVVAEGAGQEHFTAPSGSTDASGNVRLRDIGPLLRDRLRAHFDAIGAPITLKYIDPSYTIRSHPANSLDSELCLVLAQHAVHAAMAGRTNVMIGYWNRNYTHVPISLAVLETRLDPEDETWQRVLEATGQPAHLGAPPGETGCG